MRFLSRCRYLFSAIFAVLFVFGLGLLALTNPTSATAEVKYLSVKQSDFKVESFGLVGSSYFRIVLVYEGANVDGLPQNNTSRYQEKNVGLETDDTDKVNLSYLAANGDAYSLTLAINLTYSENGKCGYSQANPTQLRIPAGTKFTSSSKYQGDEYSGICFEDGLRLVYNPDKQSWECVPDGAVSALSVEKITLEKTSDAQMYVNETTGLLEVKIALTYAHTDTVAYEGAFSAMVDDTQYSGLIEAYHLADTQTLLLIFIGSENITKTPKGVTVTLLGGELKNTQIGVKLLVDGEITFYGCSDKSFSTEEYIEVNKNVNGVESMEKVIVSQEYYVFEELPSPNKTLFLGWEFNGKEYKSGERISLQEYKDTDIFLRAVFFNYGLLTGATIRCKQDLTASGIRFSADLQKEDYLAYQSVIRGVGIILLPSDLIEEKPFTLQNYSGENGVKNYYVEASQFAFDETGVFRLHATLATVLESNYNREFSARAYMVLNRDGQEEYVWGTQIERRSVYEVASKALKNHKTENDLTDTEFSVLQSYVNGVANIVYDGETARIVSEAETPSISFAEVRKNGTLITLVLTTAKENFAAVTYNGKRIRPTAQSYENGRLTVTFSQEA